MSPEKLQAVCAALGVSPSYITTGIRVPGETFPRTGWADELVEAASHLSKARRIQLVEFCQFLTALDERDRENAVINASPEEMKGATLYLVGHENDGSLTDANCCMMCKRVIINSGIEHVVLRQSNGSFKTVDVSEWIEHDDSLNM